MDPDASLKRPGGFGCATRQSSAPGLIERAHPGRVGSISERGPVPLPTLAARNASSGPHPAVCVAPGASFRSGDTPRRRGSVAQPKERPCPHRPYQFIAITRMIARSFTEQAIGHPEGEALTEAARAIWRGSRF